MKKPIIIFLVIIILIIIAGGVWYVVVNKPKACTQEAKLCPDGTYVGRTGPNCEFAECPTASGCKNLWWYDNEHSTCQQPKQFCGAYMYNGLNTFETKEECESGLATKDWKTYRNSGLGFTINYPNDFQLKEDNATSKLFSGVDGHFWIFIENDTKNLDATEIKEDYYKNDEYGYQYEDSFVKIAGVDSYKQGRYDSGVIEKYYIPYSGKIYRIEFEFNFDLPNQKLSQDKTSLINQILSTFKFIP